MGKGGGDRAPVRDGDRFHPYRGLGVAVGCGGSDEEGDEGELQRTRNNFFLNMWRN
jgi:hypothetical protein